jgi:hypothetical protein
VYHVLDLVDSSEDRRAGNSPGDRGGLKAGMKLSRPAWGLRATMDRVFTCAVRRYYLGYLSDKYIIILGKGMCNKTG